MSLSIGQTFVVGLGEVGRRLSGALASSGTAVIPISRKCGWEHLSADRDAPVLVCVREEALTDAVSRLHGVAAERLVFVQNGWIRPALAGLPGCSRGLIWFTSKGDFYKVLRPSIFSGPAVATITEALVHGGIAATAVDARPFAAAEAEKMGFNCVVGLPLAVHALSLGEYLVRHAAEAEVVFAEAVSITARALGVVPQFDAILRLPRWWPEFLRAAEPLGWVRSSVAKALEYRNGAVVRLARELGERTPANERLLAATGFQI